MISRLPRPLRVRFPGLGLRFRFSVSRCFKLLRFELGNFVVGVGVSRVFKFLRLRFLQLGLVFRRLFGLRLFGVFKLLGEPGSEKFDGLLAGGEGLDGVREFRSCDSGRTLIDCFGCDGFPGY